MTSKKDTLHFSSSHLSHLSCVLLQGLQSGHWSVIKYGRQLRIYERVLNGALHGGTPQVGTCNCRESFPSVNAHCSFGLCLNQICIKYKPDSPIATTFPHALVLELYTQTHRLKALCWQGACTVSPGLAKLPSCCSSALDVADTDTTSSLSEAWLIMSARGEAKSRMVSSQRASTCAWYRKRKGWDLLYPEYT